MILEEKEIELRLLMKMRPSIYGNSLFIGFVKLVLWLLAVGFLVAGIVLTTNGYYEEIRSISNNHNVNKFELNFLVSSSCFLLSYAFFTAVWFGRMLIRRNVFIMEMKEWNDKYYPIKKTADQKK